MQGLFVGDAQIFPGFDQLSTDATQATLDEHSHVDSVRRWEANSGISEPM